MALDRLDSPLIDDGTVGPGQDVALGELPVGLVVGEDQDAVDEDVAARRGAVAVAALAVPGTSPERASSRIAFGPMNGRFCEVVKSGPLTSFGGGVTKNASPIVKRYSA